MINFKTNFDLFLENKNKSYIIMFLIKLWLWNLLEILRLLINVILKYKIKINSRHVREHFKILIIEK